VRLAAVIAALGDPDAPVLRSRMLMGGSDAGQRIEAEWESRWVGPGVRRSRQPNTRIGANRHQPLCLPSPPEF
jgi:hypothetical protein